MNIYLQILMAFLLGATLVLFFHWKRKAEKLQDDCFEMEDLIEEQGIALKEMVKAAKKEKYNKVEKEEAYNHIKSLKRINMELELENFTLKQKPKFKIGDFISFNVEIIAITPVKIPITSLLKCFSRYKNLENFEYIYTLKNIYEGAAYKVPEREILKAATPEPTKEEIFNIESFE